MISTILDWLLPDSLWTWIGVIALGLLIAGFWLGSSSGGKQREGEPASVKIQQEETKQ